MARHGGGVYRHREAGGFPEDEVQGLKQEPPAPDVLLHPLTHNQLEGPFDAGEDSTIPLSALLLAAVALAAHDDSEPARQQAIGYLLDEAGLEGEVREGPIQRRGGIPHVPAQDGGGRVQRHGHQRLGVRLVAHVP